jgi:UDP-glucose 4-epimerase
MQSVMVVGGSGFIGQQVIETLAAQGHSVCATHGLRHEMPTMPGVTWIPCDLTSLDATASWPRECHSLLFLAQAREHRSFPACRDDVFGVNLFGLHQALNYALRVGAERFVFASTGNVYSSTVPIAHEEDTLIISSPRTYYAASKLSSELLLGPYAKLLPVIILRLFMPYGVGQKAHMLFPQLLDKVRTGQPIHLHGPDGLRANPLAVADAAEGFTRCLSLKESVTMNLAGPEVHNLRQIGETMGRVLKRQPVFQVLDQEPPHFVAATSRLQKVLGWTPATTLDKGLRQWLHAKPYAKAG